MVRLQRQGRLRQHPPAATEGKNLEHDPRATILIIDPTDSTRWIEIRGDVDISGRGALQHLNRLTRAYTPWPCYYGHVNPLEQRRLETRIICRIHPRHVVCDAIHRPNARSISQSKFLASAAATEMGDAHVAPLLEAVL